MQNKKRSEWYNFYKDRQNMIYKKHIETKYADFIDTIINNLPDNGKKPVHIHEAGCGAANVSLAIYNKLKQQGINFHISMSDKCKDMLELAHENVPEAYKAQIDVLIEQPPHADVIFSHGLLEHFNDEDIVKLLTNQLRQTNKVIHYVPSSKYKKPSFGDERLMTSEQWQKICNPTSIVEFNDGHDLILTWDINKIRYPSILMIDDKIPLKRTTVGSHYVFYEGLNISKNDKFFIDRKSFELNGFCQGRTYSYPTPQQELLYGNN